MIVSKALTFSSNIAESHTCECIVFIVLPLPILRKMSKENIWELHVHVQNRTRVFITEETIGYCWHSNSITIIRDYLAENTPGEKNLPHPLHTQTQKPTRPAV